MTIEPYQPGNVGFPNLEVRRMPEAGAANIGVINASGYDGVELDPSIREVAFQLQTWISQARTPGRGSGMLDRNRYLAPENPIQQMILARRAVRDDDIVGGAADVTEGLMFQGISWEGEEADDADIFNQVSQDLNLDNFIRAAYRELFAVSQVVVASWWERKSYTVRGHTPPPEDQKEVPVPDPVTGLMPPPPVPKKGPKRRKKYEVYVPTQLTILDPTKVIPVGDRLWGGDQLAWHGTPDEMRIWDTGLDSPSGLDPTMAELILGRYRPGRDEEIELGELGINTDRLLLLNPKRVWRHTLTRSSYERWPDLRLRGIFRLLDLKAQLMDADRVALIGAANYILLIRKGDKDQPAKQPEIDNLKEGFQVLAKLPVIISDHRLEIEIITPKIDLTLKPEKYDTLDRRIMQRLFGAVSLGTSGQRNETSLTLTRMIGRLLESRRHMMKRALEQNIARAITDVNPDAFASDPNLAFIPRQVQLDNDQQISMMIQAARQSKELSRESFLEFLGFDQQVEADRRIHEAQSGLDDIFGTAVPFNSPANNAPNNAGGLPPGAFGATGGRPLGGGTRPGQPKATAVPVNTKKAAAALRTDVPAAANQEDERDDD